MHRHREVVIGACPDYVWAVLTDVARWPEWAPALREVVPFDGGPLVRGGGVRVCSRSLPTTEWHVAEIRPHRGFTWTGSGLGSASRLDVAITPSPPARTVVGVTLDRTGWVAAALGRLTGTTTATHLDELTEALRRRCETGQRAPRRAVAQPTRRAP